MALTFTDTLQNARLQAIIDAIDSGTGPGKLRLYSGTRPSVDAAPAGTLLAELTFSDPSFPSPDGGTVSADPITSGLGLASQTATYFRVVNSSSVTVLDGNVGTSGSDLNLNSTSIVSGINVAVNTFDLVAGN